MKTLPFLISALAAQVALAAPFCAVNGAGQNCNFYDMQSCRSAAGPGGTCMPNSGMGSDSTRTPPRFMDSNPVLDGMREAQDAELRQLEIERRRRESPSAPLPAPRQPAPRGTWADNVAKATDPLTLVCSIPELNDEYTANVDIINQTVNGRSAQISDAYIAWEAEAKGQRLQWSINRYSGLLTISTRRETVQGRCEAYSKADRKF